MKVVKRQVTPDTTLCFCPQCFGHMVFEGMAKCDKCGVELDFENAVEVKEVKKAVKPTKKKVVRKKATSDTKRKKKVS